MRFLAEAEAEVEAARNYLNLHSRELGMRFLSDLEEALREIRERGDSFSKLETIPDGMDFRRALLKTFRYVVIFEILDNEILIIAVAHFSRQPDYWLNRLD